MGTRIVKYLGYLLRCVLAIIYDDGDGCVICSSEEEDRLLCTKCRDSIKESNINSVIEREGIRIEFFSITYYSSIIKEMVLRLKYKSDFRCGEALSELMSEIVEKNNLHFDIITFVPSSNKALKKRGFNQSEFLARLLGDRVNKKVTSCLKKTIETKDQIGLDANGRWQNLKECFTVTSEKSIIGREILLVDDVITTGATAFYCAKQLIGKGCKEVIVLTVAKSTI